MWSIAALDLVVAAAAGTLGVAARFDGSDASVRGVSYAAVAVVLVPVWVATVALAGGYDRRGLPAGPADLRVEPEVADQFFRRPEPGEVTNRRHDRQRDRGIDAGDGHQPQHLGPAECGLAQVLVN